MDVVASPDSSTVRDARSQYFQANGFSDAGYRDAWVRIKVGRIPVVFPNTASRKRAIPLHDLHHIATGYPTTLVGEAEIGAWEIASGCSDHWAAWMLNAVGFAYGLALAPRRVYRAFVRGRHSRSLYHTGWNDDLLDRSVGELRHQIGLGREPSATTWRDRAAFAGWVALVAMPGVGAMALAVAMLR